MIEHHYFGLDVGEKTVGVAYSMGYYAQPLTTVVFDNEDYQKAAKQVTALCHEHKIDTVIIGLPKHMNNQLGISAQRAMQFEQLLTDMIDAKIILWDERLSSKEADRRMIAYDMSRKKRKRLIDQMAAVIILQSYLDHIRR